MVPEKAMALQSSTLAWKIPWTEEPGRLQSMGSWRVGPTEWLNFHFSLSCIGEGNGNPLQCSCLENPRDGGAWWAAIYRVAQSRTRLMRLNSSSSSSSIPKWSSDFPYFLQFQSEFGNKEFMIWATVSSQSCFCWLLELLHLWLQRIESIWFRCWPSGDVHV